MNNSSIIDLAERAHSCLASGQLEEAKSLYNKALKLETAPIYEKMILASYFYKDGDKEKVWYVLKSCDNRQDTIYVFHIMDSYNIKFSDFEINLDLLQKYCKDCKYK